MSVVNNYEKYFGTPERAAENIHNRMEFTRSYIEYVKRECGEGLNPFDLGYLFIDKDLILEWLQEECE